MSTDKRIYEAWLASAELPYDCLIPLLHQMKSAEKIYGEVTGKGELPPELLPPPLRSLLLSVSDSAHMETFRRLLEQHGIQSMNILDEDYPRSLRDIPDPPGILFYQGDPRSLQNGKMAAMVGSRAASYAGLKAARKTARELSQSGVTIVSGLAYGIDSECHQGCLEGGTTTIAVVGCGLDQTYPSRNETLKNDILSRGGLLIGEYAPGSKPIGRHFPYRNRIISGMCDIVILMEAKIRSGSMTTIQHALQQGKEVYAYPGDPVSPLSEGNRQLLREGARYFSSAEDILADMNWLDKNTHVGQNIDCSTPDAVPETAHESAVYKALAKGPLGFDELLQATGMISSELMRTLTLLQVKKIIDLLPGKRYQLRQE